MHHLPLGFYVVVALLALLAIVLLVDRLLLRLERRGWIYYRNCEPRIKSGARGVLGTFQEIVQPEIRHVREDREQRRAIEDESSAAPKS